jgi:hypothetical protein
VPEFQARGRLIRLAFKGENFGWFSGYVNPATQAETSKKAARA